MNWFWIAGPSLMLAAVLADPWGKSWSWAACFLIGAACLALAVAA